jgi:hypothetical protein
MLFSPTMAPPSRPAIGSCGRAAQPAAPPANLRTLDRHRGGRCPAAPAGRMRPSPNSSAYPSRALPEEIMRSAAAIGGLTNERRNCSGVKWQRGLENFLLDYQRYSRAAFGMGSMEIRV